MTNANSGGGMVFSEGFFRVGAVAALISLVGVVMAQVVLQPMVRGAGEGLALYANPTFQTMMVTVFVQVMAIFVAFLVMGVKVLPLSPGAAVLGLASLFFWEVFEIVPRSIEYFTFARDYAASYTGAGADTAFLEAEFRRFHDWSEGMRGLRQILWATTFLLLGFALWPARGLGRLLGAVMMLNGVRVVVLVSVGMLGGSLPFGRWPFVIFSVVVFALATLWLWVSPRLEQRS